MMKLGTICELTMRSISGLGGVLWIHVQILEQASLWESRFVMYSRAAVPMSASSNLEVERAIDPKIKCKQINIGRTWKFLHLCYSLVFLGTKDGCEIFSHRSSVELIQLKLVVRCSWLEIVKKCFLEFVNWKGQCDFVKRQWRDSECSIWRLLQYIGDVKIMLK